MRLGDKIPNIPSELLTPIGLSSDFHIGNKVVFYFYPKDNTPGCTAQACNLRDNFTTLQKENVMIIGISADSMSSHEKFISKYELPFPLIADPEKILITLFGVWGPKKFMGKTYDGIHRKSFLFDETGQLIDIIEKPKTKDHAAEILERYRK